MVSAGDHGVVIWDGPYNNQIGGANPGEGNRIAGHNNGVVVDDSFTVDSLDNAILGNEILSVNEMAIDLDNEQITANDAGDGDSGPNDLLNHPVLSLVNQNGANLDIDFDLDVPAGDYRIEFFENPAGIGGVGLGEGQVFLGAVTVTHAGGGIQSFSATLTGVTATAIGSVTATATEDLGGGSYGSTSEFCAPGPVNSEQVLAVNTGTTVAEGSTGNLITTAMLETTDVDNTVVQLVYTVTTAPVNGTLYLSGVALASTGTFTQDDIDNNRITYDHDGSENFTDSFDFEVDDGAGVASTGTFAITITPVSDNDPVADNESFTVAEGGTATQADLDAGTSLLDGDTDADLPGDTLTVNTTPVVDVSHGTLTLNADGTFSYVHDGTENFTDSFTYEVDDGAGGTDTATVTITITPVSDNDPVADNESFTVAEGGTATQADLDAGTSLLDGDTDADLPGDTLTVNTTPVVDVSHGTLTLNADGTFSYVHDGTENFTDSFTYEVDDGAGGTDTATVTITITPVSDNDPVADNESFTVAEGGTATQADLDAGTSLLDGDTDADLPGDTLTVNTTPVVDVSHGTLTLNADGTFSYVHDGTENFTDSFTYEVDDGAGGTDTATVTITITPVSDNDPVADNESFTVAEGGTATQADLDAGTSLLDGDTDADLPGDTLTVNTTPVVDVSHGTLTLNADGTFSYVHDGTENFTDSFTYEVDDGAGGTDTATVTITITPVSDNDPVADNESFTVAEGGTATQADLDAGTSLLDGDTDADLPGDTLTVNTTPVVDVSHGTLTLNADGTFSYVHDGTENFTDSFTYEVDDGAGGTDTATVTITITPVSDNDPVADNESFTVAEGGTATQADLDAGTSLLDGDTDADLPGDTLTVNTTPVVDVSHGTLTLNADGTFSYVHDGTENFTDSFTYEVDDGAGGTDTATVTITITPVSDNDPVADNESFTVAEGGTATQADLDAGTSLLDGDTDADLPGDTLTVNTTPVVDVSHGTLTLNADGTFSYVHDGTENFTDSFTYEVDDGAGGTDTATVTITITPVSDAPTATNLTSTSAYNEGDASVAITDIVVSDADTGETITATLTLVDTGTGSLSANDGATYTAGTGVWTITDTVANVNLALANLVFTPTVNNDVDTTIDVSIDDGDEDNSGPLTGTITLDVTPANVEQVLSINTGATVLEGSSGNILTAGMLATTDADHTAAQLVYTLSGVPANGTLYLSGVALGVSDSFTQEDIDNDRVTYDHDGSETVVDGFAFSVDDGVGATTSASFAITVTPVNDVPTISLINTTTTISEDVDTSLAIKVADIVIADDAMGVNDLSLSGADAAMFEILGGNVLYLKAGVLLDAVSNPNLDVTVAVDDTAVGGVPDDTAFQTISVTAAVALTPPPTTTVVDDPTDSGDPVAPDPDTPVEMIEPTVEPEAEPVEAAPEAAAPPVTVVDVQAPVSPTHSFAAARTPYLIKAAGQFTRVLATNPTVKAIVERQLNKSSLLRETASADKGQQQVDHQADLRHQMAARAYLNMVNSLDDVKKEMAGEIAFNKTVMGSAIAVSTGLSVGYVVWLIRGGMLLSSLLSSIPAWQILDPLPVLVGRRGEDDLDDDESLASIIDRKPEAKEPKKKPVEASLDTKESLDPNVA